MSTKSLSLSLVRGFAVSGNWVRVQRWSMMRRSEASLGLWLIGRNRVCPLNTRTCLTSGNFYDVSVFPIDREAMVPPGRP